MAAPARHLLQQGPVLAALGRTALTALKQRFGPPGRGAAPAVPGPDLTETVPARPADLVRDYVRLCGGDPGAYRGTLPPHLFPQWGFPLMSRTLVDLPYPLARVLNGGCRLEINAPLPAGQPLQLSARLDGIDDNGRRAVIKQRLVTSTAAAPEALVAWVYAIVPLTGGDGAAKGGKVKRERPRVPQDARELAYWHIPKRAGLDFALTTGDFNPVHWIAPYARAAGFRSTILHGFATLGRAVEGLNRGLWAGDPSPLETLDVQFTRPVVLPARVGLYTDGAGGVFIGDAPGGPAYMVGRYTTRRSD